MAVLNVLAAFVVKSAFKSGERLQTDAGSDGRRNTCVQPSRRSLETQGFSGTVRFADQPSRTHSAALVPIRLKVSLARAGGTKGSASDMCVLLPIFNVSAVVRMRAVVSAAHPPNLSPNMGRPLLDAQSVGRISVSGPRPHKEYSL
jgi:hypothetical protein